MAGKTNLELLTLDENRIEPFLTKWWNPLACSFVGVVSVLILRYGQRRPLISGIQLHILAGVSGWTIGYNVEQYRAGYLAERDAVLRHYLQTHPEDFPEPERKKYADLFLPWIPVR